MLSKFYSVLIGIVIALTLVGLVLAGVTKIRTARQAAAPESVAVDTTMPVPGSTVPETIVTPDAAKPNDADTGIGIQGTVGTDLPTGQAGVKVDAPKVRDIAVVAKNFKFEPSSVRVKKGEQVRITVTSAEGVHNLFIAGYDLRSAVKGMGESASVSLTADKTGTFDMWCEIGSHRALGMTGKLIVE